jgi:hypothetical protein
MMTSPSTTTGGANVSPSPFHTEQSGAMASRAETYS